MSDTEGLPIVDASNPTEEYLKARGPLPGFELEVDEKPTEEDKPEEPEKVEEEKVSLSKVDWETERAKIAREAAEAARKSYDQTQEERRIQAEAEAEEKELEEAYRTAVEGEGDSAIDAQRKLLQKQLNEISKKRAVKQAAPLIEQAQKEFVHRKYTEHVGAFGLDPNDKEVLALQGGLKDLNALLIEKTTDEGLVARMLKNPGVKKALAAVKTEAEKEKKAARIEGMAKVIGTAKGLEGAKADGGKALSLDEIEIALYKNPKDAQLQRLYREAQKKVGRPL